MKKHYVVINLINSEKWRQLLESIAVALHINLVFFADGVEEQFSALYDCPTCGSSPHPVNITEATKFNGMKHATEARDREIRIIRLDKKYLVAIYNQICCHAGNMTDFNEKVNITKNLLISCYDILMDQLCEGQRTNALTTLHQTNRTILAMFQGSHDALEHVIELILSAALIVFDTEGSWLEYHIDDQRRFQSKGNCNVLADSTDFENKTLFIEIRNPVLHGTFGVLSTSNFHRSNSLLENFAQEAITLFEDDKMLRRMESNLSLILDAADSMVLLVNNKRNICFANKTANKLLNRSLHELILLSVNEIDAPWRACMTAETVKITKGSKDLLNCACGVRYIDWSVHPIDADINNPGWLITVRDCTDFYHLQELAGRIESLVNTTTMLNVIAHEVRNPLATFKGLFNLIRLKCGTPNISKYVDIGLNEINKLTRLLDDCSQLGRIVSISLEETDLKLLMEEIIHLVNMELVGPDIEIVTSFNPVLPILADRRQLTQAILNLVKNAFEALGQIGNVTLNLNQTDNDWVEIQVCDSGPGIPDAIRDQLFKHHNSTKAAGTGLGLAITSAIINSHNGEISVLNRPEGGTCFSIRLPVNAKIRAQKFSYSNIMIVTNDDILRLAAERIFDETNIRYYSIKRHDSIFSKIDQINPHLILVDEKYLNMHILKKMIHNIISNYPDIKILVAGDKLHIANDHVIYIPKPLNDVMLIHSVKSCEDIPGGL